MADMTLSENQTKGGRIMDDPKGDVQTYNLPGGRTLLVSSPLPGQSSQRFEIRNADGTVVKPQNPDNPNSSTSRQVEVRFADGSTFRSNAFFGNATLTGRDGMTTSLTQPKPPSSTPEPAAVAAAPARPAVTEGSFQIGGGRVLVVNNATQSYSIRNPDGTTTLPRDPANPNSALGRSQLRVEFADGSTLDRSSLMGSMTYNRAGQAPVTLNDDNKVPAAAAKPAAAAPPAGEGIRLRTGPQQAETTTGTATRLAASGASMAALADMVRGAPGAAVTAGAALTGGDQNAAFRTAGMSTPPPPGQASFGLFNAFSAMGAGGGGMGGLGGMMSGLSGGSIGQMITSLLQNIMRAFSGSQGMTFAGSSNLVRQMNDITGAKPTTVTRVAPDGQTTSGPSVDAVDPNRYQLVQDQRKPGISVSQSGPGLGQT